MKKSKTNSKNHIGRAGTSTQRLLLVCRMLTLLVLFGYPLFVALNFSGSLIAEHLIEFICLYIAVFCCFMICVAALTVQAAFVFLAYPLVGIIYTAIVVGVLLGAWAIVECVVYLNRLVCSRPLWMTGFAFAVGSAALGALWLFPNG